MVKIPRIIPKVKKVRFHVRFICREVILTIFLEFINHPPSQAPLTIDDNMDIIHIHRLIIMVHCDSSTERTTDSIHMYPYSKKILKGNKCQDSKSQPRVSSIIVDILNYNKLKISLLLN